MSANTPGGYLGQGGKRMSRKPDFNLLSGVPALYDAMRQAEFRRALQPGPELPPEAITQIPGPGEYPIPSMGAQHDGRVIRQIGQRGIGAEPVAPVAGTDKSVEYPPGQSLMPSAVAPTSKTVEYPMPAPPTSSWDRPEDRRLRRLRAEWEQRRGDAAWTTPQQAPQQALAPSQPPAAGQSASGTLTPEQMQQMGSPSPDATLTPEQMQQMGSPSPDARRYDGLNYKSNNVVSASRAVGEARGRMGGSAVGRKQSEAISQMTRMANGMAEGRGGQQYRDAVAAFETAIASGDQAAITAAESNLGTLLSPMLDKFDARFKAEVGDIGIDIRKQFMDTLRGRIQAGTAGTMRSMPQSQYPTTPGYEGVQRGPYIIPGGASASQPQGMPGAPQVRAPQPPAPRRPGAGGASAPTKPTRTPTGLSIHEFGSMADVMDASAKGGTIQSGDLVKIAGSNFTAVPSFDQYGNPEWGFVPAVVFGGGGSGSPEMAIPDPFSMPVDAWGESLSEAQRQTMIDTLLTDPRMRSSLDRATLEQIDAVRRSRQGLLRSPMSAKDRESAVARLKAEENAALHSAMASVASKARGAALFASDYADQVRAREQEDAQIKSDMELEKSIRLSEANAIIGEQRDEAKEGRDAARKDRDRAITAAMEEQKRAAEAERQRVADFGVPLSSEAATGYVESGGLMKAEPSQAVAAAWNSLDDQQKQLAVDLLTDFAEEAPAPPRMQLRLRNGALLTDEMDQSSTNSSKFTQTISVQSGINPESHLPERDLIRLFESIRGMPTPPAATLQQTDSDDPTEEHEQSSLDARREYETKSSEWQQGVQKILIQDRPPQYSAEYYRENPDAATMVQKRFGDWETQSFRPAVKAARDSGDPGQLRETLGDLYSWVAVMENAGHSTNYQQYPGVDMNNGRAAFVESVIKAMGTGK